MDLKKLLKIFEAAPTQQSALNKAGSAIGSGYATAAQAGIQQQQNRAGSEIGAGYAKAAGAPNTSTANFTKPVVGPNAKARTGIAAKPSAVPAPTTSSGPQAQAPTMSDRAATDPAVAGFSKPAAAPAPAPVDNPVAADVGAGQSLAAMGAAQQKQDAQASFQKLAGITPTVAPSASAPAPSPTAPEPVKPIADFSKFPTPSPAEKPQYGGGYDPSKTEYAYSGGQAAKPAFDNKVKDGFGGDTNITTDSPDEIAKRGPMGIKLPESDLEELEEELAEMMRLSGVPLNEKAVSKQQQKFMGMVYATKKGKKPASKEVAKAAKGMSKKDARDFAKTKHKGLPQKVSESVMLEAGNNLEHIITRFKHETKNFLNGNQLDDDLYNALYDYYVDNGEMPYTVAKAKQGQDPYQWVEDHFENALAMMGHLRQFQETVIPVVDNQLSELARLAGLSESNVNECGDMGMGQEDRMNISTNMSSDGTKSVSISAQGEEAESLIQMLKLAGMGHMGHDNHSEEPVVVVSGDDDEMMEYANEPNEEYQTVNSITRQGNDLNREKRQYADRPKLGDNPMAETKQDLSNVPTKRLQDFVKKHSGGGVPTFGAGAKLKRVQAELKRREQGMSEELTPDQKRFNKDFRNLQGARLKKKSFSNSELADFDRREQELRSRGKEVFKSHKDVDEGIVDEELQGLLDSVLVKADEGSIKGGDRPGDLTGTWSSDPPEKGKPNVPPPVPMDPVYPAATKSQSAGSKSGIKK